jgi:eukaryotic-like serine/threonine-protein kinase
MSLCINPNCSNPSNLDSQLFCNACNSELLLDGRFRVKAPLGEGGFAKTYEVYNLDGEIRVLKVLTRKETKAIELFQREARVLGQLSHPGIPGVENNAYFVFLPQGASEPLHCLTMEKVVGLDLKNYVLRRGKAVDQAIVFQWLRQLAMILRVVHSQHILHRDIKPSNIMLKTDGHLVLIDFGTVRSDTNIGSMYTRVMSELYTPDEQLRGQPLPQSDFFAMGRTAVFLLTGQDLKVFYDPNTNELRWQNYIPGLAPEFRDFLEHLMAPFPSQRPANADQLLEGLMRIEPSIQGNSIFISSGRPSPPGSIPIASPPVQFSQPSQPVQNVPQVSPPENQPPGNIRTGSTGSTGSTLSPSFVERCQREIAEYVGPIAPILCKRTLERNPNMTEHEFVNSLCLHLSDPQDIARFRSAAFS